MGEIMNQLFNNITSGAAKILVAAVLLTGISVHAQEQCKSCGEVVEVRLAKVTGKGSGVGAGLGAVMGGLVGNTLGSGTGRALTTVAGAAAGAYAGNEIEKRVDKDTIYEVVVKMQNGKTRIFKFDEEPHWQAGDLVKVSGGNLIEREE